MRIYVNRTIRTPSFLSRQFIKIYSNKKYLDFSRDWIQDYILLTHHDTSCLFQWEICFFESILHYWWLRYTEMCRELMCCLTIRDNEARFKLIDESCTCLSCRSDEYIEISEKVETCCRNFCDKRWYISDMISFYGYLEYEWFIFFVRIGEKSSFFIFTWHFKTESIQ